ncbi:MAG TPA: hypothetical protein VFJ98_10380 [Mycobacteriales bacterium]|nr:hypothetical protein [Mycobacteriales bacterium]
MSRRVILAVVLVGVVGGSATAFADPGSPTDSRKPTHELCLLLSKDPQHQTTQDYCVTWPGPVLTD